MDFDSHSRIEHVSQRRAKSCLAMSAAPVIRANMTQSFFRKRDPGFAEWRIISFVLVP
jgi:hypothetical protein